MADVRIEAQSVAPGIHMLVGRGGNIGVSTGADGIFLIDDQFAPLHDRIVAAVAAIQPGPIGFILNTHWHGDHTGGNEAFGSGGALIFAHAAVRARMSSEQFVVAFDRHVPPSPPSALPVVTFTRDLTLHLNGQTIRAVHVPAAHTDGDVAVHFVEADVIHAGDVFFAGRYPFIDVSSGGSIDGVIAAASGILESAGKGTKIIPGHGPLANRDDLLRYRDLLLLARERVATALAAGMELSEIVASDPLGDQDPSWGSGFITAEGFVKIVYASLTADS
jgi:glyoxylase-like metal-dependent hydrolase (beta-lactamase superfamily II)